MMNWIKNLRLKTCKTCGVAFDPKSITDAQYAHLCRTCGSAASDQKWKDYADLRLFRANEKVIRAMIAEAEKQGLTVLQPMFLFDMAPVIDTARTEVIVRPIPKDKAEVPQQPYETEL